MTERQRKTIGHVLINRWAALADWLDAAAPDHPKRHVAEKELADVNDALPLFNEEATA